MAQHDYSIADQSGLSFRADLNNALSAIQTLNSSAGVEPASKPAYMLWADTTSGFLKIRNSSGTAWINVIKLIDGEPVNWDLKANKAVPATTNNIAILSASGDLVASVFETNGTNITANLTGSITGNAATVTTNANLTGPITSVGNATSIGTSVISGTSLIQKPKRVRTFTSGTQYIVPSDVKEFFVVVLGATGGVHRTYYGGGGCGGGGYSEKLYTNPTGPYTIAIGAAGSTSGSTGGTTRFDTMYVTGSQGSNKPSGSTGGVASGGSYNRNGGTAGGNSGSNEGGGGGGGAGRGGAGGNGGNGSAYSGGGGGGGGGGNGSSGPTVNPPGGSAPTSISASAINEGAYNDSTVLLTTSDACNGSTGTAGTSTDSRQGGKGGGGSVSSIGNPLTFGSWPGANGGAGGLGTVGTIFGSGEAGSIVIYEVLK